MTRLFIAFLLLFATSAEAAVKLPFSKQQTKIPFVTSREFEDHYEITSVKYVSPEKPGIEQPGVPRYRIRITFMPTHEKYIMSMYDDRLTNNYFSVWFITMDNGAYALGSWKMKAKNLTSEGYTMDMVITKQQLLGVEKIKGLLFLLNSEDDHYSLAPLDGKEATEDTYNITLKDINKLSTRPGTLKLGENLRYFTIPCIMDSLFLSQWHLVDFKIVSNDKQKSYFATGRKEPTFGTLNSMMCKMDIAQKEDFSR
ncbi:MAG: hypothetical protein NC111_04345 [Bacteroides sp.]|nr:hypothetical protein [Bacteroides sp.]MCM1413034.1 hypothetical protein [Bacteroides sp.]MCM1471740.1 hypothetical protein [Bacteroides sp.]